jgi:hypothetical protein
VLVKLFGLDNRFAIPGVLLLILGAYVLVRAFLDLALTRTITGEVLWHETWESKSGGEDQPAIPWLDYLALDDGTSDRTVAWGLPSEFGGRIHDGDAVTIVVRPWSRRIGEVTAVGAGRSRELVETVTAEDTGNLALKMLNEETPAVSSPALFRTDDVAQVVGRPVVAEPMPLGVQFQTTDGGRTLLLVQSVSGLPGRVAWRANSRGQELPGFPGGAFVSGERAAFRHGDTTVVLTLMGEGRAGQAYLPWLLERAQKK